MTRTRRGASVLPRHAFGWFLCVVAASMLSACGGTNNLTLQNPPPPASKKVSIAFQPAPEPTINLAGTTSLTAVVNNDSANLGVDWSLLCPANSNCGTLSSQHTGSGAGVTYTPPGAISGNSQTFTIEAFATADNTKNVVANLAVTGFANVLKGTYVFSTKGIDGNGSFQLAGVVSLDGNGGITGGEQTLNDQTQSVSDAITGGSYYVGPDGRGLLTITTADQNIGQQGVENLSLVVLSNAKALIATSDDPNLSQSFETSSGSLELQTSTVALNAGYAFALSGVKPSANPTDAAIPMAMGGILKIDSPGTISGSGSVVDEDEFDPNNGVSVENLNATVSGTVTNPDTFGAVKINLRASFTTIPVQLTGYIVDAQHIKLIESDNTGSGNGFGSSSGVAIGQGGATGTFVANQTFAGTYVFGILGQDFSGLPTSMAAAGVLTADASGNLSSGFVDEFVEGTPQNISDSFAGTYTLDPTGTGRADSQINFTRHEPAPELIFYLAGNGNPPVLLSLDTTLRAVGIGLANPQAASKISFGGRYGMMFTQSVGPLENDSTAQFSANAAPGTLAGIVDSELQFNAQPNTPFSGEFTAGGIPGQYSGSLTDAFFPTPGTVSNTLAMDFYMIDSTQGYFIETDSLTSAGLTFGYFATRTPVCASCQ